MRNREIDREMNECWRTRKKRWNTDYLFTHTYKEKWRMSAYKHLLNSNRLTVTNDPHFSIVFASQRRIRLVYIYTGGRKKKKRQQQKQQHTKHSIRTYLHAHPLPTNQIKFEKVRVVFGLLIWIRFRLRLHVCFFWMFSIFIFIPYK